MQKQHQNDIMLIGQHINIYEEKTGGGKMPAGTDKIKISYLSRLIISALMVMVLISALGHDVRAENEADTMQIQSGVLEYEEDFIEVSEGVTIYWDEYQVDSEWAEIDQAEDRAEFFENVVLYFEDGSVESSEMIAHLEEDRFVFTGDVAMEQDPEEDEAMELTAERLEMFGETGNFEARGDVEIIHQDRVMTGEEGDYDDEEEIFYLRENVVMEEAGGDTISSDRAEVHLGEEDAFYAEGNVEIEMDM